MISSNDRYAHRKQAEGSTGINRETKMLMSDEKDDRTLEREKALEDTDDGNFRVSPAQRGLSREVDLPGQ